MPTGYNARVKRFVPFLLILQLLFQPLRGVQALPEPQAGSVEAILARMTPAERVGQLFLVTYYGASIEAGSDIERLITQSRVGGVVFLAANDNFTETAPLPQQALALSNQLQAIAARAAQGNAEESPPFIPLFIALNHEGDGYPFTELRSGVTTLPNEMAVGATWEPAQAEAMGRIAGEELSALGINLLLGPSLDVLENPRPQAEGDLGARAFGGDPFWVGEMGKAYIRGVHAGSGQRMAVAAKFFPGHGSSDRDPEEEVPTVRKSLEQLVQVDLLPFFAVTGEAPDRDATTDALMAAHIRFQGLQGNIYQNTSPFSFDSQAFEALFSLTQLAGWRETGGVIVSDSLGVRAVKRFYDPSEREFNPRQIAQDAFNAGNDVLFLSEFGLNPRQDQATNIADTITWFVQRYQENPTFARRVDDSVRRILGLKLRLYGSFEPDQAQRPESDLGVVGQNKDRVLELAQSAASLISPSVEELRTRAPEPPGLIDRLIFFTDTRAGRQCSTCALYPLIDRRALENAVLQFYGPSGSGQVIARNLQSFTFDDLAAYLNTRLNPPPTPGPETPTPEPPALEAALSQADWVVFAMLNVTPDVVNSSLVSTFLTQRPDIATSKKVVVFAFNAPYYLDTTDLSKVTAFYALYSKAPAFVDVAARLLFREAAPRGAPPVTVQSSGYDLLKATAPDPGQVIELFSDAAPPATPTPAQTPEATQVVSPTTGLRVGDVLNVRTGVIRDLNGRPVPDRTTVQFTIVYQADQVRDVQFIDTQTHSGVASISVPLNRIGILEIAAASPPALRSVTLQVPVQQGVTFQVTQVVPPTDTPTITPLPSATPVPATPTVTATPPNPGEGGSINNAPRVSWRDFALMLFSLAAVVMLGYRLGGPDENPRRAVRLALIGALGVLAGYNFFAMNLPGANLPVYLFGAWSPLVCIWLGAAACLGAGWYWLVRREVTANSGGRRT
jgi:beta-N-acetylhexosaminidase